MTQNDARIRLFIADDSALMRRMLQDLFEQQPDFEVVGSARDGEEACSEIRRLRPDVVTMDVFMPKKDGLACVRELMSECPLPIIMLSALTRESAGITLQALQLGAVDFVAKPRKGGLAEIADELLLKVRTAARSSLQQALEPAAPPRPRPLQAYAGDSGDRLRAVMAVAASTGGPSALLQVVPRLDPALPVGWVFVQHMPEGFTAGLAEQLNEASPLRFREAFEGLRLAPGSAILAQGGKHLEFDRNLRAKLVTTPPVNGVRPAFDVTLRSLLRVFKGPLGVCIMTGMGSDGAHSLVLAQQQRPLRLLVQAPETCVVAGMPKAALALQLPSTRIAPLDELGESCNQLARELLDLSSEAYERDPANQ